MKIKNENRKWRIREESVNRWQYKCVSEIKWRRGESEAKTKAAAAASAKEMAASEENLA